MLEICRKSVGCGVPLIVERARLILACAIFAIATHLQRGSPTRKIERVLVVDANGEDVLVELCPFARYVVAGMQSYVARVLHIVEEVSPTVRQTSVGIRIPDTPIEGIASEGMLTCELTVIGGARAVVVFGTVLLIRLCVYSLTPCVAVC